MHNIRIDLNLLTVAESLYRHLNVSLAARELGLSQSAVSHALKRLRDHYDDPMFVRVSKGVSPTRFAKSIQKEIEELVVRANTLSAKQEKFDPAKATGRIVIATNGYSEIVVLSKVLPTIRKEAPKVIVSIRPTLGELPKRELEENIFDLAIAGFYDKLPEGFYKAKLFNDTYSVAYRKDHPRLKGKISQKEYFDSDHAMLTLKGDFVDYFFEEGSGKKRGRNIVYGTSSFTAPAWTISSSDMLLTGPTRLLKEYARYFPLNVVDCPVAVEPNNVQMVWHKQTHHDPLQSWFRSKVSRLVF